MSGELTANRPLSVLVENPLYGKTETAAMSYGITTQPMGMSHYWPKPEPTIDGILLSDEYFQQQSAMYNMLIIPINALLKLLGRPLLPPYTPDQLRKGISQETGIPEEDLKAGKYFVTQSLSDPGRGTIQFFYDLQKTKPFPTEDLYVFNVDLDISHGDEYETFIPDEEEETRGAVTLANLNDSDDDGVIDRDDDRVFSLLSFRDDDDLMKLTLQEPRPIELLQKVNLTGNEGLLTLTVSPGTIRLWKGSTKAIDSEIPLTNGVYTFHVDDFPLLDAYKVAWVEAIEPSTTDREIQIDLEFLGAKDTVRATATWGDLDIDSDNDNGLDALPDWTPTDAEDSIEDDPDKPGKFLAVNDGDMDHDGIPNFADAGRGPTSPFTPLVLTLPGAVDWDHATIRFNYSASDPTDVRTGQGTPDDPFVYRPAPGHLRLWKLIESSGYSYIEPQVAYTTSRLGFDLEPGSDHTITLFVEGVRESASIEDRRITVEIDFNSNDGEPGVIGDAVMVTVVRVDLDIDSDNTNGFNANWGRSAYDYEDHIEDIQEDVNRPGKLIAANMGDVDNGKIPNFADGLNLYGNEDEDAGGNFVPLILELPEPLDVANARIRLTYSASDPAGVKKTGQGTVDYPDVYVPAPGHLRIWTVDGSASRNVAEVNAGGHFVASGAIYNATNFDLRADRTIRLYVEGIDGSAELADQAITVEIDPNDEDEEPGFLCEDRVRMTVIKLDITRIKYPNDGMSFTTRDEPPDHVENEITLTANIEPDYYDAAYNGQIDWTVENNRWYNKPYNSGTPTDPPNGYETTLEIAIPPIPGAANGRNWHKLSYRVKATVTIANTAIEAMAHYITQDEIDMLRQQYIDMEKETVPDREEFANAGQSAQGHFCIGCGSAGDGACKCLHHEYHIWSIMNDLENVRANLGHPMTINSGYRCPIHNANINPPGAKNSQHIYGTAADVAVEDWDGNGHTDTDGNGIDDDWETLEQAAQAANASYIEPYAQTGTWVHMDWR